MGCSKGYMGSRVAGLMGHNVGMGENMVAGIGIVEVGVGTGVGG